LLLFGADSVFQFSVQEYKETVYRTIILSLVLYGCETWSLKLREKRGLRVLRRTFGPKRDEITGE